MILRLCSLSRLLRFCYGNPHTLRAAVTAAAPDGDDVAGGFRFLATKVVLDSAIMGSVYVIGEPSPVITDL